MKIMLTVFLFALTHFTAAQTKYYMLAGTYTKGASVGIYVYDFNTEDGSLKAIDSVNTPDPSFLAVAPNQKFVYAVSEVMRGNNSGKVRAFSFDSKTGRLHFLNEQSSAGDHPCYITVDKTGKWLIVGNYTGGSLAVLPINTDGSLGEAVSTARHSGNSINKQRQEAPHVHATVLSPDNKFLLVPDLGIDKVMVYSFDDKTGKITPATSGATKLADGSGPRHFDFHPNKKWAYVVEELSGNITAFEYSNGSLRALQTIRTVPEDYDKPFTGADIHVSPDGKFLYSSNRDSSNTIAIFKIDKATGKLEFVDTQSSLGRTPRNFNFDPSGNFLLVANQNSNSIVVLKRDRKTGLLSDTGQRTTVGNPVCIKWIRK